MDDISTIARRIVATLFLAQSFASGALIAISSLNALSATELSGHAAWAGAPTAIYLLGSASSAILGGYLMDRVGRRPVLLAGLLLGAAGASVAAAGVLAGSFVLLLMGLALVGSANGSFQLGRFAAADVYPPDQRGRAIANFVLGGTVGAIVGPFMIGPAGRAATSIGLVELAGPYLGSVLLYVLAAAVLAVGLHPDPSVAAARWAGIRAQSLLDSASIRTLAQILHEPGVITAIVTMIVGQAVMVMLMVITSLHMKAHEHSLSDISVVISAHTLGMYAFSVLSGRLADRLGRGPVIITGACVLIVAALTSALSPDVAPLAVSLFLLGLGWNFCYVGGSTLLADHLSPGERSRVQGFNDLWIALASMVGSLGSGVIFAAVGFAVMGGIGAVLATLPLVLGVWCVMREKRSPAARA